jgi:YidC/Oxa1 family membrane protein insertase
MLVPPLILLLVGGGIFFAVYANTNKSITPTPAPASTTQSPAPTTPAATPPAPAPTTTAATPPAPTPPTTPAPTTTPPAPIAATPPTPATPAAGALKARAFPFITPYEPLGSIAPAGTGNKFEMQVYFTPVGAGFERLALANVFDDPQKTAPEVLQSFRKMGGQADPRTGLAAMAANRIEINGTWVAICDTGDLKTTFWRQSESKPDSATFESIIEDGDGKEVAKITRTYELKPGTFEIQAHQHVENLTGAPMTIRWEQFGPVSSPVGAMRYGGDVRRVRFGYMLPAPKDPERTILADDRAASMVTHRDAIGAKENNQWKAKALWPNTDSTKADLTLAWAGITNRYFTVAVYPLVPVSATTPAGKGADRAFNRLAEKVDRYAVDADSPLATKIIADIALVTTSAPIPIPAGQSADVSMGLYAGPSSREIIAATSPIATGEGLPEIVMYTLGGPCAFCTFQWVTGALHGLLLNLERYITHDWALSIMLLVVCVRTILHPITRWTQRRMYFFSKEMAKIQPKMKAIQDKYKDDPVKLREEQTRMMGEHGAVYASGALGCLPAFLQSPVWIALSAMIGFAYELHNTPGFFGLFQKISPTWTFLGDLGSPDRLVQFGHSIAIPILGDVDSINILPFILGIVFFIQQKYLTPPQTTQLTPEQEQQQKIMRVMTVVMFPLMMYNAPAGFVLYFATNSTIAIFESKLIRAKAEEEWKEREAVKAAKLAAGVGVGTSIWDRKGAKVAKPEGWLARFRRIAEDAQKMRDEQKKRNIRKK